MSSCLLHPQKPRQHTLAPEQGRYETRVKVMLRIRLILIWYRLTLPFRRFRANRLKPIEPSVRGGERFELAEDNITHGLTSWKAPFTGDFECKIPKGTLLEVLSDSVPHAKGFYCKPVEYEKFEAEYVPESDRKNSRYGGYAFVFMKSDIGTLLK